MTAVYPFPLHRLGGKKNFSPQRGKRMTTDLNHMPFQSPSVVSVQRVQSESVADATVIRVERGMIGERIDCLAVEEPLAIAITHGPLSDRRRATISITMRTPGHDKDLVTGYLVSE